MFRCCLLAGLLAAVLTPAKTHAAGPLPKALQGVDPAVVSAPGRYLRLGLATSTGRYGGAVETRFDALSLGLGLSSDRWAFELALPYLQRHGAAATPVGDGVTPGAGGPRVPGASGWGDTYASLTRRSLVSEPLTGLQFDLHGAVKFGSGNTGRGLSTGKNDYSLGVEAHRYFGRVHAAFSIGFTDAGQPAGLGLRDHAQRRLALSWFATDDLILGLAASAGQPLVRGGPERRDVTSSVDLPLYGRVRLDVYFTLGLAEGSAHRAGGARLSFGF